MRHRFSFLLVCLLFLAGGYSLFSAVTIDGIEFSGQLVDGSGTPLVGTFSVTFGIFSDPTDDPELWLSDPMDITTDVDGKFTTVLGPIASTVFSEDALSGRWVEITVGSNPPISPRTFLPHAAYSVISSGVEAGGVSMSDEGIEMTDVDTIDTMRVVVHDAKASAEGAEMNFYDLVGAHRFHLSSAPAGATMELYGSDTSAAVAIVPDGRNGLDVLLPNDVIQSHEIFDEPGLAMNRRLSEQPLDTAGMTNIVSVAIDVPTTGYVLVQAKSVVELDGGTGQAGAWLQIDTMAGGTADDISFVAIGGDRGTAGQAYGSVSMQRVYLVEAGAHTFFLEGQMVPGSTVGIDGSANASQISALFIPTSYGGMVAAAVMREGLRPLRQDSLPGGSGLPAIREEVYDLRDLERRLREVEGQLQAARSELETMKRTSDK